MNKPYPLEMQVSQSCLSLRSASLMIGALIMLATGVAEAQTVVTTPDPAPRSSTTVVTTPQPQQPASTTVVSPAPTPSSSATVVTTPDPRPQSSTTVVQSTEPRPRAVVDTPAGDPPSIFESGYQGLLAGTVIGLGGGYLAARRDGFERSDWRALGLGMGIGALSGAALGITLGIADRSGAPGGRYVARDLSLGAGFGAVIGTISGGIAALAQDKPERVLFGASIGVLAGAGVGIITGIIEGQSKRQRNVAAITTSRLTVQPSLAVTSVGDRLHAKATTLLPGVSGRF